MDRELLLTKLNELRDSLPEDLVPAEEKNETYEKALTTFQNYNERLENSDENNEYDLLAHERENLRISVIEAESLTLEEDNAKFNSQLSSIDKELQRLHDELNFYVPQTFAVNALKNYRENLKRTTNPEERNILKRRIQKLEDKLKNNRSRSEIETEIARLSEMKNSILSNIERNDRRIERNNSELSVAKENARKMYELSIANSDEKMETLARDTDALYTMVRYFNSSPRTEVEKLIFDVEMGRISDDAIASRLQNINALVSSKFYDFKEEDERRIDLEEVMERRQKAEARREELLEKVSNEENYVVRNEKYDEIDLNIKQLNILIQSEEEKLQAANLRFASSNSELQANANAIAQYSKFIEASRKRIESISIRKNISEESRARQIEAEELKIKSFESSKSLHESRVESLQSAVKLHERDMRVISLSKERYQRKIEFYKHELLVSDISEKERDMQELDELESVILSTHLDEKLARNSCYTLIDELISFTGGKKINREEEQVLPAFVYDFTPEQRKLYDEFMTGKSEEEQKEINEEYDYTYAPQKKSTEKSESNIPLPEDRKDLVPVEEEKSLIALNKPIVTPAPILPPREKFERRENPIRSKLKKFKDLSREKLEKVKKYFKENWKKIVSVALIVGALALGVKACNDSKKSRNIPTSTLSVSDTIKPEVTPTPNITFEPIVSPTPDVREENGKKDPEIPIESTPPEIELTPNPGIEPITPDPVVTPEPTPVTPEPTPVAPTKEYVLDTGSAITTGSTRPADSSQGYNEGEAVYNPNTNTWVDSQGNKNVGYDGEEGATRYEGEERESVEQVDEEHNKLTNPNMNPISSEESKEKTSVPVEEDSSRSVEEVLADPSVSDGEKQNVLDALDAAFEQYEEESQKLGR